MNKYSKYSIAPPYSPLHTTECSRQPIAARLEKLFLKYPKWKTFSTPPRRARDISERTPRMRLRTSLDRSIDDPLLRHPQGVAPRACSWFFHYYAIRPSYAMRIVRFHAKCLSIDQWKLLRGSQTLKISVSSSSLKANLFGSPAQHFHLITKTFSGWRSSFSIS